MNPVHIPHVIRKNTTACVAAAAHGYKCLFLHSTCWIHLLAVEQCNWQDLSLKCIQTITLLLIYTVKC